MLFIWNADVEPDVGLSAMLPSGRTSVSYVTSVTARRLPGNIYVWFVKKNQTETFVEFI